MLAANVSYVRTDFVKEICSSPKRGHSYDWMVSVMSRDRVVYAFLNEVNCFVYVRVFVDLHISNIMLSVRQRSGFRRVGTDKLFAGVSFYPTRINVE